MSEKINLEKFMAKSKEIEIDGTKFKISALTIKDSSLLMGLDNPDKAGEAIQVILGKILRDSFPDITQEQINDFSLEYLEPLMTAFSEVNSLNESKITPELKARIEQMKNK